MAGLFHRGGLFDIYKRHKDAESEALAKARARKQQRQIADDQTSGIHDTGGIASDDELSDDMSDPEGVFLGLTKSGKIITYNGPGSLVTNAKPGGGKGSKVLQTNLGHLGNKYSILAVDIDREAHFTASKYRREVLGQEQVVYAPSGVRHTKSVRLDPLAHVRKAGQERDYPKLVRYAGEISHTYISEKSEDKGDGSWVDRAGRSILEWLFVHTAWDRPDLCNVSAIYDLLCLQPQALLDAILKDCTTDFVASRIEGLIGDLENDAGKQLHWKIDRAREALEIYQKDTQLGLAQQGDAFDVSRMKREPITLYLTYSASELAYVARDLVAQITSIVKQLIDAEGDQKIIIMIDECSNLPRMELATWIRLLRKYGIQIWIFIQSKASLEALYGKAESDDILSSCAIVQSLTVDPEMAERISKRAGTKTSFTSTMSRSPDGRSVNDGNNEAALSRLPVPELLNMASNEQVIEVTGHKVIRSLAYEWWKIVPFCDRLRHFSERD